MAGRETIIIKLDRTAHLNRAFPFIFNLCVTMYGKVDMLGLF